MKYYKLHLIRHGLTAGNLQGLYIGSGSDLPLCDEGRAQLKTLVKDFDYPQVPLVFTSPMKRATETAEILFPGVRQIELDDLREMAFGKFEGRAVQELVKDPEFAQWMDPTSRTVPEGAEDRQMFFNRTSSMLMKMFEYMLRTHTEEAACVTHGGVIMNMLSQHALPFRKPEEWMTVCGWTPKCGCAIIWPRRTMSSPTGIWTGWNNAGFCSFFTKKEAEIPNKKAPAYGKQVLFYCRGRRPRRPAGGCRHPPLQVVFILPGSRTRILPVVLPRGPGFPPARRRRGWPDCQR